MSSAVNLLQNVGKVTPSLESEADSLFVCVMYSFKLYTGSFLLYPKAYLLVNFSFDSRNSVYCSFV